MIRSNSASSECIGATYHGLLNSLLLEAGECVAVGHFAGLLVVERRFVFLVWHLSVLSSKFCCYRLSEVRGLYFLDFLKESLQGARANQGQTLDFEKTRMASNTTERSKG